LSLFFLISSFIVCFNFYFYCSNVLGFEFFKIREKNSSYTLYDIINEVETGDISALPFNLRSIPSAFSFGPIKETFVGTKNICLQFFDKYCEKDVYGDTYCSVANSLIFNEEREKSNDKIQTNISVGKSKQKSNELEKMTNSNDLKKFNFFNKNPKKKINPIKF
jgi:hypothetical protein